MKIGILLVGLLLAFPSLADQELFTVLSQDSDIVKDIKAEGQDVWIRLASGNLSDEVTVRISNKNKDYYRPWFTGDIDLVSKGFRGNNVWSDWVQTVANYIEYWHNGNLILHLERK